MLRPLPPEAAALALHEDARVSTLLHTTDLGKCSVPSWLGSTRPLFGVSRRTICRLGSSNCGMRGGRRDVAVALGSVAAAPKEWTQIWPRMQQKIAKPATVGCRGCSARHRIETSNLIESSNLLSQSSLDAWQLICRLSLLLLSFADCWWVAFLTRPTSDQVHWHQYLSFCFRLNVSVVNESQLAENGDDVPWTILAFHKVHKL